MLDIFAAAIRFVAGWSSLVARRAHNPKVVGSNPAPATKFEKALRRNEPWGLFFKAMKLGASMRIQTLEEPIQEVVNGLGFELWGLEFLPQGRHSLLRVYIENEKGVTVDDCATVSHQISTLLDVENVISDKYMLEVSSPGLDRFLFKPEQYVHYCGETLQLSLKTPIQGSSKMKGELLAVDADRILIKTEKGECSVDFAQIQKARLVPKF